MNELKTLDKSVLLALKNGNREAFKSVFDSYEKRLYYFIFSLTKSDYATEEILQEVFLKVWKNKEMIDPQRSFNSFIYTIAKNLSYNFLRNISNRESLKREYWKNITYSHNQTEDSITSSEYKAILNSLLEDIPLQKRKIFIMSKFEGKSNQEIADIMGISPKTVKNHLWKTLQILKADLLPYVSDSAAVNTVLLPMVLIIKLIYS